MCAIEKIDISIPSGIGYKLYYIYENNLHPYIYNMKGKSTLDFFKKDNISFNKRYKAIKQQLSIKNENIEYLTGFHIFTNLEQVKEYKENSHLVSMCHIFTVKWEEAYLKIKESVSVMPPLDAIVANYITILNKTHLES